MVNNIKRKGLILAVFSIMSLVGCSDNQTNEDIIRTPTLVKTIDIGQESSKRIRTFPGVVDATQNAALSFRVSGSLVELPVKPGDLVNKGDILARLDKTDFQVEFDAAASRFELASADMARAEQLFASKQLSKANLDRVKAEFKSAEASLRTARNALNYTELVAPFNTSIAKVNVKNFEYVNATQPIITVQDINVIDVQIQIPQSLMARIEDNAVTYQPEIRFDSAPDLTYRASLKEWSTTADPATDSYQVIFTLKEPDEFTVLPGMTAEVLVDTSKITKVTEAGFLVPLTAIFSGSSSAANAGFVWVLNDEDKLEKRLVTLGEIQGDSVLVTRGLNSQEQIVVAGVDRLMEGQWVKVWQKERGI